MVIFTIGSGQFQSVTICHRLAAFLAQAFLQPVPVLARRLVIRLLDQRLNDDDDREPPCFSGIRS